MTGMVVVAVRADAVDLGGHLLGGVSLHAPLGASTALDGIALPRGVVVMGRASKHVCDLVADGVVHDLALVDGRDGLA
jgi:hypothetical protein